MNILNKITKWLNPAKDYKPADIPLTEKDKELIYSKIPKNEIKDIQRGYGLLYCCICGKKMQIECGSYSWIYERFYCYTCKHKLLSIDLSEENNNEKSE